MYSRLKKEKKKERNIFINFNTNHRREITLIQMNMGYCLLRFDALKLFSEACLHRVSLPDFNFFNVNPQILQLNRNAHLSNCLNTKFHHIPDIELRVIRRRNYN